MKKDTQCKHIDIVPILKHLLKYKGEWCNWIFGDEKDVHNAMPTIPDKLVLAKMKQMIKNGLVKGCDCGCRGDFEISEKGENYLRPIFTDCESGRYIAWYQWRTDIIANGDTKDECEENLKVLYKSVIEYESNLLHNSIKCK